MVWWDPGSRSVGSFKGDIRVGPGARARLLGLAVFALGMCAGVHACGGQMPGTPNGARLLTISGSVYAEWTAQTGEPALADALITVLDAEGSSHKSTSDGVGFYTVSVRAGSVSISASKAGYTTRASMFDMSNNTVLNFSLSPS